MELKITPEIAECVGLWLAEGDTKTKGEITFTNNCSFLIEFFAKSIQHFFKEYQFKPRVYVYSSEKETVSLNFNCRINYYIDKRANKPYYIYRIGSVKLVSLWKNIVNEAKNDDKFYEHILRGFFAGEGNLKEGSHSNRTVRIAQGKPNGYTEKILNYYGVKYRYSIKGRSYVITGKWNWDILAKINIADLHPIKKEKFWRIYRDYKELHYPDHYLKENISKLLEKPYTSLELSKKFKRSQARVYDILSILKNEAKVQKFNVRSKCYWIRANQNKIIISQIKKRYLSLVKNSRKTTVELSKEIGVCWKSAFRRLTELQKLNLVVRDPEGLWNFVESKKEVIVL